MAQADLIEKNLITYNMMALRLASEQRNMLVSNCLWLKLEQIQIQQQMQIQSEVTIERGKVQVKCKARGKETAN